MNSDFYVSWLLENMENAHLTSGKREINCRCPECGDSRKSLRSAHMYISIPTDNSPSKYYCHKCNTKGIVTYKKLIEWGIYNQEVALELESINHNAEMRGVKIRDTSIRRLINSNITRDDKSEFKRKYISDRLGVDLSYEDLSDLKIVLNLNDLLRENKIQKITRHENVINDLDREFIGFLSLDNTYLNMRRTCPEGRVYKEIDKRYINYAIFMKDDAQRFYTIPTQITLNTPNRIPLHIAEGPFDILSVYLNCRNREPGIYCAVSGNNYMAIITYFMIDMRIPNLELHIYPDNDKYGDNYHMKKISDSVIDRNIPMYIHHNTYPNEKDFGVPSSRISESITEFRRY